MSHINTAFALGAAQAEVEFNKEANIAKVLNTIQSGGRRAANALQTAPGRIADRVKGLSYDAQMAGGKALDAAKRNPLATGLAAGGAAGAAGGVALS
jgi:hypothetical protein